MFTREQVVAEIQRVAVELGRPPGRVVFARETGIKEHDWNGKYWARWSDALAEAGVGSNALNGRTSDGAIAEAIIGAIRDLSHFPTHAEMKLRRRADPDFPSANTIGSRGTKSEVARLVLDFCSQDPGAYTDVIAVLESLAVDEPTDDGTPTVNDRDEQMLGHVYLLKLGQHYKIGRSNAFGRREHELSIQMPERATTIHVINTDDPVGIEAYWHRRFSDKRVRPNAEWFELVPEDVRAFKRRKFQ